MAHRGLIPRQRRFGKSGGHAWLRAAPFALGILFLPGSIACRTAPVLLVQVNVLQFDFSDPAGARDERARSEAYRLGAVERLWVAPQSLRVTTQAEVVEREEDDEGMAPSRRRSVRSNSVKIFDFATGTVWESRDGGPYRRRLLEEIEYEWANERRRSRRDFLAAIMASAAVRGLEDLALYQGDLRFIDAAAGGERRLPAFAGMHARRGQLAAEPGSVWEVVANADLGLQPWEAERSLAGALGLSREFSRQALATLQAFPVKVTVRVLPDESGQIVTEHALVDLQRLEEDPSLFAPPPADELEAAAVERRLEDPGFILDLLRREAEDFPAVGRLGLILRLEKRMRPDLLPELTALAAAAHDPETQVELARAALRLFAGAAWPTLRRLVTGEEGLRALGAAEALVAEGDRRAMPAIIHILLKRQEYTDIDSLTVVLWGVEHLRVLSQVGIDDLVQLAAERDRDAPDPTEALGRELEHWLRWWEARRAEYPGL